MIGSCWLKHWHTRTELTLFAGLHQMTITVVVVIRSWSHALVSNSNIFVCPLFMFDVVLYLYIFCCKIKWWLLHADFLRFMCSYSYPPPPPPLETYGSRLAKFIINTRGLAAVFFAEFVETSHTCSLEMIKTSLSVDVMGQCYSNIILPHILLAISKPCIFLDFDKKSRMCLGDN